MVDEMRRDLTAMVAFFIACIGISIVTTNIDVGEMSDYFLPPARTSPFSRWYNLAELGFKPNFKPNWAAWPQNQSLSEDFKNNIRLLDLSDKVCIPQLVTIHDEQILQTDEQWELGVDGRDKVGYPSVVRNVEGRNPDGKYYLFYSTHDPYAGIGVAVAEHVEGPYRKLRLIDASRRDSRVLRAPKRPRGTSHFSSPVVVWNSNEALWFMYFHYYNNEWDSGGGHQRTGLATTDELASHRWKVWMDSNDKIIAVLPTTSERWMNSQSSYHAVQGLPNGVWLAFLRGTGGEYDERGLWNQDPSRLGFAVSRDGRRWAQLPGNPIIHQQDGRNGANGVYRPLFVGAFSKGLLLGWSEASYYDAGSHPVVATSENLLRFTPVSQLFDQLPIADGPLSIWRIQEKLYVFYGDRLRQLVMLPCPLSN